jgi:hypothetical protein
LRLLLLPLPGRVAVITPEKCIFLVIGAVAYRPHSINTDSKFVLGGEEKVDISQVPNINSNAFFNRMVSGWRIAVGRDEDSGTDR